MDEHLVVQKDTEMDDPKVVWKGAKMDNCMVVMKGVLEAEQMEQMLVVNLVVVMGY